MRVGISRTNEALINLFETEGRLTRPCAARDQLGGN